MIGICNIFKQEEMFVFNSSSKSNSRITKLSIRQIDRKNNNLFNNFVFLAIATSDVSAIGGSDYTSQDGSRTVTLNPGETGDVDVAIIDDVVPEGDEQFNVVLGGDDVGSTITTAVVTIIDDDGERAKHTFHLGNNI